MNDDITQDLKWWKGACLYQIYPRSFADSNGSGTGDLKGITARLDYVASLGVEGVWISPFFKSPMKDFGYDVSDYRDVDPLFGTLADFDALLARAHELGLKIIIDLVLSHTSDQHPWFTDKPDYYVWADAKADRTEPNNWVSVFGGSAWSWSKNREQFYLHNFLKEQPDLNYHNPDVRREALDIVRFWLDRGVDGLRLDVINFLYHDEQLRDNPVRDPLLGAATQFEGDDPYSAQAHIYDKSRPEMIGFLKELRGVMDEYPGTFTLGEIGDDHPYERAAEYTADGLLNTCYNPQLMAGASKALTASLIREPIEAALEHSTDGGGWPSWAFSNHDVVRAASRWLVAKGDARDGFDHDPRLSKMLIAMLGCLYGTAFIYQGEELGLPEAKLEFDQLQDPWGKNLWPAWQGRDGCRTPMPWDDQHLKGSWLPIPPAHLAINAARQDAEAHSVLNFTRRFITWRKGREALRVGDIHFIESGDEKVLAFERRHDGEVIQCRFDLTTPYGFSIDDFNP